MEFLRTSPDIPVEQFLEDNEGKRSPYLVFDKENDLGPVSQKEIKKHHKKNHHALTISDVMYRKFRSVMPQEYLFSVIQKMNSHPFDLIPVMAPTQENKVVGVVTNDSIMKLLVKQEEKKYQNLSIKVTTQMKGIKDVNLIFLFSRWMSPKSINALTQNQLR